VKIKLKEKSLEKLANVNTWQGNSTCGLDSQYKRKKNRGCLRPNKRLLNILQTRPDTADPVKAAGHKQNAGGTEKEKSTLGRKKSINGRGGKEFAALAAPQTIVCKNRQYKGGRGKRLG